MHAPGAGIGTILATCGSVLLNGTQTKEWGWNRRGSGEGPSGQGGRPGRDTMLAKSRSCHGPEPPPPAARVSLLCPGCTDPAPGPAAELG